jgi:hypothetical protein
MQKINLAGTFLPRKTLCRASTLYQRAVIYVTTNPSRQTARIGKRK